MVSEQTKPSSPKAAIGDERHPTLHDVARLAGVSTSTAARALAGTGRVAEDTRLRVTDAANRLAYVPNAFARGLRTQATKLIGVLIADLGNTFYAEVAAGAERVLRARGYRMLLADSDGGRADVEVSAVDTFQSMRIDGLIITPSMAGTGVLETLARNGTPVVEVDHSTSDGCCDLVIVDNEHGAYLATRHLIELGHHDIGLVVGESEYLSGSGRLAGYREALHEAGLELVESLIARTSYHPADSSDVARVLIARHPEMTAVFATNGPLALGVFLVLREQRIRIPRDMSLVAFDDADWMAVAKPGITTVSQPSREIGRVAATMLLDRLEGNLLGRAEVRRLPTRLVRRGSTAPPRAGT